MPYLLCVLTTYNLISSRMNLRLSQLGYKIERPNFHGVFEHANCKCSTLLQFHKKFVHLYRLN
uniref:Uncharacterized protein n=1 Tax=Arundo donax TaxID=35708 RepID=A0A0A9DVI9_ARUDO